MIWVHCGDQSEIPTALTVLNRLAQTVRSDQLLLTADEETIGAVPELPDGMRAIQIPADTPTKVRAFLSEYAPFSAIWIGGAMRPVLVRTLAKEGLPAVLINARTARMFPRGFGWLSRTVRASVAAFDTILTADGATANRLTRSGVSKDIVKATGPILEEPLPLPHDQYELAVMNEAFGTRPLWFAAQIEPSEVLDLAAAQLSATRKNHRLLLVLSPKDPDQGLDIAQTLREAGLRVGVRSDGVEPTQDDSIYIADLPGEVGLWCRLCPVTYIGGSLRSASNLSPFDPIALGSAVVHGTHQAPHEARYERLANVEASREVRSAPELGIAISALIAPERSARMALAGWTEITQASDHINRIVQRCTDAYEAPQ